jgi:hypothetical protein
MSEAPIAFFAYRRPWHTQQALESLARCEGAEQSDLYIFCDGPKRPEDLAAVEEVREIVKVRKWCGKVHVVEREENWGLAKSIIAGVTEIANKHGRVIVLEDDLVLSSQFLNFMNDALEIYNDIPKVMHISGYMFPAKDKLPETFFYRATSCWGWATWKRAWDKFSPDADSLLIEIGRDKLRRKKFDIEGSMNYYEMLQAQAQGRIDSWAVRWYASVFLNGGLCLHPGKSQSKNIGHDCTGEHCVASDIYDVEIGEERITDFTRALRESEEAVEAMVDFYQRERKFYLGILKKIRQQIAGILKIN